MNAVETQLAVACAVVVLGFLLSAFAWALRRIIITQLDKLGADITSLTGKFDAWREHYDRRLVRIESRMDLWEVTNPGHPLGRRRDDTPSLLEEDQS